MLNLQKSWALIFQGLKIIPLISQFSSYLDSQIQKWKKLSNFFLYFPSHFRKQALYHLPIWLTSYSKNVYAFGYVPRAHKLSNLQMLWVFRHICE